MNSNYYSVLGVDKSASKEDIKKAYKKFVVKNHPDKFPEEKKKEATKRFHEVQEAYEILSDEKKRQAYDSIGHEAYKQHRETGNHDYGNSQGFEFHGFDFNGFDFNDIFGGAFSGQRGFSKESQQSFVGEDLRYNIEITLDQAYTGFSQKISIPRYVCCKTCSGNGHDIKSTVKTCSICKGRGKIVVQQFIFQMEQICDNCSGKGKVYDNCKSCSGSGKIYENSNIEINIPSGVKDRMKLRLAGQGSFAKNGKAGDLYLFVTVKPHKIFKVVDSDLLVTLPITVFDAVLGVELKIPGIDKEECIVKVLAGSQPKTVIKLVGKGMKKIGSSLRGNLIISLDIEIPKNISSKEIGLFEQLKKIHIENSKSKSLFEKLYSYWTS